jgi:thiol:disulfide interchange protein DsbA
VDVAKFSDAYRSFSVNTSAGQAEQRAEDYRIPGVPTLAIAGKYRVGGDHAAMLKTSDELIAMARAANKKGGK